MGLLDKIVQQKAAQRQADMERALINYEGRLGGEVFGPVPKGHRREFFCLDQHTWVWHEEWKDEHGQQQSSTTRYEVRPTGVIKTRGGKTYHRLSRNEASNLAKAVKAYEQRVAPELDRLAAHTS